MRISDWSSDVCSSDLRHAARNIAGAGKLGQRHSAGKYLLSKPDRFRSGEPLQRESHGGAQRTWIHRAVLYPDRPSPGLAAYRRRSEEHTSELQSLMRISYAVFCLKKKTTPNETTNSH